MNYISIIKRQSIIIFCSVLILVITIVGVSYAFVFRVDKATNEQVVTTGNLAISYGENNLAAISDKEFLPMTDEDGNKTDPFNLTIENTGSLNADYKVLIYTKKVNNANYLSHDLIKVSVDGGEAKTLSSLQTNNTATNENDKQYILTSGVINSKDSKSHAIRVWLSDSATINDTDKLISLQLKTVSTVHEQ